MKTVLKNPGGEPVEDRPGFLDGQDRGEKLHHAGVRIHRGEGREVALLPAAQNEPLGLEVDHRSTPGRGGRAYSLNPGSSRSARRITAGQSLLPAACSRFSIWSRANRQTSRGIVL